MYYFPSSGELTDEQLATQRMCNEIITFLFGKYEVKRNTVYEMYCRVGADYFRNIRHILRKFLILAYQIGN